MTTTTPTTGVHEFELASMKAAIDLASASVARGGGPFGAMVIKDGDVVARGDNQVTANLDPSAHAEVSAIRGACRQLQTFSLEGCTLITSCEPCPMCLATALWARVDRLVFSADRHDAAAAGFDDRRFYDLFETRPQEMWPMAVEHLDLPNRTAPFDAWVAKADRVHY